MGMYGGSKAAPFLRRNELRLYRMPFESFWGSMADAVSMPTAFLGFNG